MFDLKAWRKGRLEKLTQARLAAQLGVTPRTIVSWEKGETAPPGRLLELALQALESEK